MAQACLMHSATLAEEGSSARDRQVATDAGSPQAAFITSAARCKRKAVVVTSDASGPATPRESDACVASSTPSPRPPEDEEIGWEFDPYLFIKRLPSLAECVPPRTRFLLPRRSRRSPRKTLVLDLDETLVHSTLNGPASPPDFTFCVEVGGAEHLVAVRQRPHLHAFLRRVSELYEVVVFTASQAVYAEQLLDVVDPGRCLIAHRVFRDACVQWEGNYLKDLTVLGRDLAHTLIIDNSPQAFGFQLDNGVPIESWYDDDEDEELLRLLPWLESVACVEDVRPAIQSKFRLREVVDAVHDPCEAWCG